MSDLLPCGNCGAPARWVNNCWRVKCTRPSCGVEGGRFERQRDCIAAWNQRAPAINAFLAGYEAGERGDGLDYSLDNFAAAQPKEINP